MCGGGGAERRFRLRRTAQRVGGIAQTHQTDEIGRPAFQQCLVGAVRFGDAAGLLQRCGGGRIACFARARRQASGSQGDHGPAPAVDPQELEQSYCHGAARLGARMQQDLFRLQVVADDHGVVPVGVESP